MNLGEFCVLFSFHLLYSLIFCCCNLQSFHQRRMPSTTISKSTLCCLLTLTTLLFVVVARVLCFVYIAGEIASSRRLCFPSNFLLLLSVYKKKKTLLVWECVHQLVLDDCQRAVFMLTACLMFVSGGGESSPTPTASSVLVDSVWVVWSFILNFCRCCSCVLSLNQFLLHP